MASCTLNYLLGTTCKHSQSHWRHLNFEVTQFGSEKNKINKTKNNCKISTRVTQQILWENKKKIGKKTVNFSRRMLKEKTD